MQHNHLARLLSAAALTASVLCTALAPAHAQTYPTKSITVVSSSAPGGQSDVILRFLANLMKDRLGQPVVVENRPGGFALVAVGYAMSRPADGYTLLMQGMGSAHPIFNANPQAADLNKTMAPVGNVYSVPLVLFSRASLPAKDVRELAALAKQQPEGLKFGMFANSFELATRVLRARLGGDLNYLQVQYRGDPQMITALIAGEIDFLASTPTPYIPHVKSGTIRPLLVAAPKRSAVFPNTPTAAEAGIADFDVNFSVGVWAPMGTPRDVIARLSGAMQSAMQSQEFVDFVHGLGAEPETPTPEGLAKAYASELKFWTEAVRISGYKPQ